MRRAACALWLGLVLGACAGTEGTLVVTHRGGTGNAGSSAAAGAGGVAGSPASPETPYVPGLNEAWQARLDGAVVIAPEVDLYYLDVDQQDADDLARLHAEGRHYLCYLSAGSFEPFRRDADDFPERVIGNPLASFGNENWLDVRDPAVRDIMARRVAALAGKGCDGIPPSSLTVHLEDTGFDLTLSDALDYARWIAERIHAAGMSAGLAGPAELTSELWPSFEFGLAIDCVARSQCAEYAVFSQAQKPVLHVEFGDEQTASTVCKSAETLGFSALVTTPGFDRQGLWCRDIL